MFTFANRFVNETLFVVVVVFFINSFFLIHLVISISGVVVQKVSAMEIL